MRKTHLSICLDVVGSLKTGCFSKFNKNHEAARLNNLLPTLDPKKIILDNQDQKSFKSLINIDRCIWLFKHWLQLLSKCPFLTKDIGQMFALIFDTALYFHICLKIYCALAYLFGSKFKVHQTSYVLSNLVDE